MGCRALTGAQNQKQLQEVNFADSLLASVFPGHDPDPLPSEQVAGGGDMDPWANLAVPLTREAFISAQRGDASLARCWSSVVKRSQCSPKQPFFVENGVLMRQHVGPSQRALCELEVCPGVVYQVVVPVSYRQHVLALGHEHFWAGHPGITKTYGRILRHFFWPAMRSEVARYCKTCLTCQTVGKPNWLSPPAPLQPIPAMGNLLNTCSLTA